MSADLSADLLERLVDIVGPDAVRQGGEIGEEYTHDETLTVEPTVPLAVVLPASTDQVADILRLADAERLPVVARGSGTGLSGAAVPLPGGLLVGFDRMGKILDIDEANHVAVVQPGVTLAQLEAALTPLGLTYPVSPGESSASLGGNVATNAGGMRAIRYGVTRHHVLGLEAVLPGGTVIRTGGRFVKSSTGYDLTQLLVGSEGTLALVTEVTVKLQSRPEQVATVLAPFETLRAVGAAVPRIVASGASPMILEYVDFLTMAGITRAAGIDLGIPRSMQDAAQAYLVVVLAERDVARLDADVESVGTLLAELGALDVYVLPPQAGADLIVARERAFYVAKASGADDIIDVVVPRAAIPDYLATVGRLAAEVEALVTGCGHVGDGNVHLSVFLPDRERREQLLHAILRAGIDAGGAISGEHGIGTAKKAAFAELTDPANLALLQGIKQLFDPHGILNPGRLFDPVAPVAPVTSAPLAPAASAPGASPAASAPSASPAASAQAQGGTP